MPEPDNFESIKAQLSFLNTREADYLSTDWWSFLDLATGPRLLSSDVPRLWHLDRVLSEPAAERIINSALSPSLVAEFKGAVEQARVCVEADLPGMLDNRGKV